jgi:hypothetical protein
MERRQRRSFTEEYRAATVATACLVNAAYRSATSPVRFVNPRARQRLPGE